MGASCNEIQIRAPRGICCSFPFFADKSFFLKLSHPLPFPSAPRLTAFCNPNSNSNNRLEFSDVAASVEVHFENKDGGFFLKHIPRQYYPVRGDSISAISPSTGTLSNNGGAPSPAPGSVLSIDKFTVFQTSEPVSVRATYGPFSTKQTVPARYIVPDPLDALPGPETRRNLTAATILDAQELGARHLDMSAHLVGNSVPRDSPVLRVLFHAGSEAGGRRQLLLARHQRVCVVLHASLAAPSRSTVNRNNGRAYSSSSSPSSSSASSFSSSSSTSALTAACSPDGENGVCLAQITIPADWWAPLPPPDASGRVKVAKSLPRLVQVAYSVLEPRTEEAGSADNGAGFCRPRVQIQPVTPLGPPRSEPGRLQGAQGRRFAHSSGAARPPLPEVPAARPGVPSSVQDHRSEAGEGTARHRSIP